MVQPPCQIVCRKTEKTFRILLEAHPLGKTLARRQKPNYGAYKSLMYDPTSDLQTTQCSAPIDAV